MRVAVTEFEAFAVTTTLVFVLTAIVEAVNVTLVVPPGMVTLAGAVTVLLAVVDKVTMNPEGGASPEIVTVPVDGCPPETVPGLSFRLLSVGGVTANGTPIELEPRYAVTLAVIFAATGAVAIDPDAEVPPAGTVNPVGGLTALWFDVKWITSPPDGAGDVILTEPTALFPPATVAGARVNELSFGAVIVSAAEAVLCPIEAVIFALVSLVTAEVAIENVAVVLPLAIRID